MLELFTTLCRESNSELNIAVQLINCFRSLVKNAKDICDLCEHNLIAVLCNCAPLRRDVLPETEAGEANPWHEIWCRLLEFICHLLGTARIEKDQRAVYQVLEFISVYHHRICAILQQTAVDARSNNFLLI